MIKKIYLIGSGGHASSCIDVIEKTRKFKICGLFSDSGEKTLLGYKVVGNTFDLIKYSKKLNLIIAFGSIKKFIIRKNFFIKLKKKGHFFPKIISPNSVIAKNVKIDEGSIIFHDVVINTNAVIGKNCIINTKSCVEHDSYISDHAHISTGVMINGNCKIGEGVFIGSRTVLRENINIKSKTIIGFGKVIGRSKI